MTREKFGDIQLHIEWAAPPEVKGSSQGRGNSGVLIMGLYEIQVLDTYRNPTYADGHAGAIYGQWPPLANVARPPGEWQSYDIAFEAPRFEAGAAYGGAAQARFRELLLPHRRLRARSPQAPVGCLAAVPGRRRILCA